MAPGSRSIGAVVLDIAVFIFAVDVAVAAFLFRLDEAPHPVVAKFLLFLAFLGLLGCSWRIAARLSAPGPADRSWRAALLVAGAILCGHVGFLAWWRLGSAWVGLTVLTSKDLLHYLFAAACCGIGLGGCLCLTRCRKPGVALIVGSAIAVLGSTPFLSVQHPLSQRPERIGWIPPLTYAVAVAALFGMGTALILTQSVETTRRAVAAGAVSAMLLAGAFFAPPFVGLALW